MFQESYNNGLIDKVENGKLYEATDKNNNSYILEVVDVLVVIPTYMRKYTNLNTIYNVNIMCENDKKIEGKLSVVLNGYEDGYRFDGYTLLRKFEDVYPTDEDFESYKKTSKYDLTEYIVKDELYSFTTFRI